VRQIILLYGVEIWATYTYLHILNVRWSATVLQAKKLGWRPGKETIVTMTSSCGGSKITTSYTEVQTLVQWTHNNALNKYSNILVYWVTTLVGVVPSNREYNELSYTS